MPTVALAAGDTTPPTLVSFSFTPTTIDTSASQQTITFTARITDDLAGLSYAYVEFDSPSGQYVTADFYSSTRVSGTAQDGTYQENVIVPRYSDPGTWTARYTSLRDQVNNARNLTSGDLSAEGFPTSFTQTSGAGDTTPPTLVSFSFTPTTIDTSASQQTITFTARITDDLAGLSYAYVEFDSPSGQYVTADFYSSTRVSGTAQDGTYQENVVVPRYSDPGTWTARYTSLRDQVNNARNLTSGDLSAAGFPTSFTQTSGAGDTTPPTLVSFSFTPTTIDTSASQQTITFTARITDDLAGLSYAYVEFDSPSGQYVTADFYSSTRVSGTAQDGTYQENVVVPRYSDPGTWTARYTSLRDQVNNARNLTSGDLSAAGFPTSFTIGAGGGGGATCQATNRTTSYSDLQSAITNANAGDTIQVSGTCDGVFVIDKNLTLKGSPEGSRAILERQDIDAGGTVVSVGGGVQATLKDLVITEADLGAGGTGIYNRGALTLSGTSWVTGNTEAFDYGGDGIYNTGTLVLNDSARVSDNKIGYTTHACPGINNAGGIVTLNDYAGAADDDGICNGLAANFGSGTVTLNDYARASGISNWGNFERGTVTLNGHARVGGIYNDGGNYNNGPGGIVTLNGSSSVSGGTGISNTYGGTLIMNGSSSVSGNTKSGIYNDQGSIVTLNDSSSVTGNSATDGGGIYNFGAAVYLTGSSSVSGNSAAAKGGGIYNGGTAILKGSSSVTGNTAGLTGGGIFNDSALNLKACRNAPYTWTGVISPNTPDDPPTPSLIMCSSETGVTPDYAVEGLAMSPDEPDRERRPARVLPSHGAQLGDRRRGLVGDQTASGREQRRDVRYHPGEPDD